MSEVRLGFKSSPSLTHTEHLLLARHCSKHLKRIIQPPRPSCEAEQLFLYETRTSKPGGEQLTPVHRAHRGGAGIRNQRGRLSQTTGQPDSRDEAPGPRARNLNRVRMRSRSSSPRSQSACAGHLTNNGIADRNKGGFHRCPARPSPESHVQSSHSQWCPANSPVWPRVARGSLKRSFSKRKAQTSAPEGTLALLSPPLPSPLSFPLFPSLPPLFRCQCLVNARAVGNKKEPVLGWPQ